LWGLLAPFVLSASIPKRSFLFVPSLFFFLLAFVQWGIFYRLYSLLIFCRDLSLFFRVCMLLLHGLVEEQDERRKERKKERKKFE
jgi:hypothetical protein